MGELLIFAIAGVIYLAPTLVAAERGHPNAGAILALNLLLGWTVLGWIGALVWALTGSAARTKTCPQCAERVLVAAVRCRFCGAELKR